MRPQKIQRRVSHAAPIPQNTNYLRVSTAEATKSFGELPPVPESLKERPESFSFRLPQHANKITGYSLLLAGMVRKFSVFDTWRTFMAWKRYAQGKDRFRNRVEVWFQLFNIFYL